MLSSYAQTKIAEVEKLANQPGMNMRKALIEKGMSSGSYYTWKKKLKKGRGKAKRKYTRKAAAPFVETISLESPRTLGRFICLVGEPAEVMAALKGLV